MELELTYDQLKSLYNMTTNYLELYNGEHYETFDQVSSIIGDKLIEEIKRRKN